MIPARTTSQRCRPIRELADPETAGRILRSHAGIDWPDRRQPNNVRIDRAWPLRDGGLAVEWSFDLGDGLRHSVHAVSCDAPRTGNTPESSRPVITPFGLRKLLVLVPQSGIRIQSPDCDPGIPHLAECLDPQAMAGRLAPYWRQVAGASRPGNRVECRTLGYRAGRRAAIGYRVRTSNGKPCRLLGKTYRDGRGERLVQLHAELRERLAHESAGRVRVPAPITYLADVQMALFSWSEGGKRGIDVSTIGEIAAAAVDVLPVLHRTSLDGLAEFTVADELAVVDRWRGMLEKVDGPAADSIEPLTDALRGVARFVDERRRCTVHRDYYERQITVADKATTLLDLDTLACGSPCVDLGNLLAHLFLKSLAMTDASGDFARISSAILRRYVNGGGTVEREALIFYWASALFRVGAVHALRTATRVHTPALWKLAGTLVEYGQGRGLSARPARKAGRFDPEAILRIVTP